MATADRIEQHMDDSLIPSGCWSHGFFKFKEENTALAIEYKKRKKRAEEFSLFILRVFAALALPLTVLEALGASALFEHLNFIMGAFGPFLFLLVACVDLIKLSGVVYRLWFHEDEAIRANEYQKLKQTGFINLVQPVIFIVGIGLFVATLFGAPVGLLLPGVILIIVGAGLSFVRYLIKAKRYRMMRDSKAGTEEYDKFVKKAQQNMIKAVIGIFLTAAFAFFFFPVGIPLVTTLVALSVIYSLAALIPSFMALWQGGKEEDFFTTLNVMHMLNILVACAGIAFVVAAIAMPPLAIAGIALLGLSILFSTTLSVSLARKKLLGQEAEAELVKQNTAKWEKQIKKGDFERVDSDDNDSDDEVSRLLVHFEDDAATDPSVSRHINEDTASEYSSVRCGCW